MSDTIISVENLGKAYRIGMKEEIPDTIVGALQTWIKAPITNFRKLRRLNTFSDNGDAEDIIWALKDVSFEVKQGEVVGIIGRNGAGKSTLLKILSRITEPTTGRAVIHGRVSSLLEVGTGFHPELTGRENVYMNGTILGMTKKEIDRKFDEIVDFSGVEKFLDTPIKRYSSGMNVRLAFAVAAHLDPEILIIDEVLAVGDVEFQKKCLGKMQDVARGGRTVLFVSHNMSAVRTLCHRAVVVEKGSISIDSTVDDCLRDYLGTHSTQTDRIEWDSSDAPKARGITFRAAYVCDTSHRFGLPIRHSEDFIIGLEYEIDSLVTGIRVGFALSTTDGLTLCGSNDFVPKPTEDKKRTCYTTECLFPGNVLNAGTYLINFGADRPPQGTLLETPPCLSVKIEDPQGHGPLRQQLPGVLRPALKWEANVTELLP